jgi:hypothetical protein
MAELALTFSAHDARLYSAAGSRAEEGIVVAGRDAGAALYGPYVAVEAGEYTAWVTFDERRPLSGAVVVQVYARLAGIIAAASLTLPAGLADGRRSRLDFSLARRVDALEVRVVCVDQVFATITRLDLRGRSSGQQPQELEERIKRLEARVQQVESSRYLPPLIGPTLSQDAPFLAHSTCCASDFLHPRYHELVALIKRPPRWQRKQWEFVFIMQHLLASGLVGPGRRGLVFGVGRERLPALFARLGAQIVATDAPQEVARQSKWAGRGEHASSLSAIHHPDLVEQAVFDSRVSYQPCDMKDIAPNLTGFDFNWSSCCFEHLGSLEAGLEFVVNAVEKTLCVGGLAVHTTEFNLTSNSDTLTRGPTVLYRRRDLEELIERLRARGHTVAPFSIAPDVHCCDGFVDMPPFSSDVHLKLLVSAYVCTSAGIVVRRGR